MSKSPFDINQILPNYFDKKIFRTGIVLLVMLFLFTAWSNDFKNNFFYISCPETSYSGCLIQRDMITNNQYIPESWDGVYLQAGESIGEKPNEHYFAFESRAWLLIFSMFIINHGYYWVRTKKFKPEINKKNYKKLKERMEEIE